MILQSVVAPLRKWNIIKVVSPRCYSIDYLTSALKSTQVKPTMATTTVAAKNKSYPPTTSKDLSKTQTFWNKAKIELEYTLDKFELLPDIQYEQLYKQRLADFDNRDPYSITEYDENVVRSKKTFGIKPQLLKPLPEILLLGHTNVGKSSLINNLFLNKLEMKTSGAKTDYAFVSRRAGYTKTLNCFNVGKKLRIIDSPGYGQFGEEKQGKVVLDYIANRHLLRRVFILIDSTKGFRVEDLQIIDHLIDNGVPFEIVFTKVDEIISKYMGPIFKNNRHSKLTKTEISDLINQGNERVVNYYKRMLEEAKIGDIVTLPKLLFNNSSANRFIDMRYGYKEIRFNILQSCGLL